MKNEKNNAGFQHPEAIPNAFVNGWNERDVDKLVSIFDEEAEFVNVVGLWWHDKSDIRKAHDYGLKVLFKDSMLEIRRLKLKYLSDNIAIVHARMRLTGQSSLRGQKAGTRQTIFTFVVHRNEQGWSCAAAHNTDIVAGMESNLRDENGDLRSVDYRERNVDQKG